MGPFLAVVLDGAAKWAEMALNLEDRVHLGAEERQLIDEIDNLLLFSWTYPVDRVPIFISRIDGHFTRILNCFLESAKLN